MNSSRHMRRCSIVAVLGMGLLFFNQLAAQKTAGVVETSSASTNAAPSRHFAKSPVNFFREVLAMTPEEQGKFLSSRPPETRRRIEAKLTEYTALSPDERELRLRATELHWYLLPLMKMPASSRAERIALIPPDMRKPVEERLAMWGILPPPLTEELLENEQIVRIFAQSVTPTAEQLQKIMADIPPSRQKVLKAGIERWQAMPEEQRRRLCRQFSQFFDLTPEEKQKSLTVLSDAERRQMDKTLQEFEKLPRDLRQVCIQSFQKFTEMSLPERELFLLNAELWKTMSPDERQAWRDLVHQVPNWPPLPPMPPPLPPGFPGTAVTNGI